MNKTRFEHVCRLFDEYNRNDPKTTQVDGKSIPDNLLYAQRMTAKLTDFKPDASESLKLAARSQHIGRWEIPRKDFTMNRKGYLQWRSKLKMHHAQLAATLMEKCGYEEREIVKVKDLLMKKQLKQNPDTQALEDVICLVFLEFYFDDFANEHEEEKLVNILKKTIAKMSDDGSDAVLKLPLSSKAKSLIAKANT